MKNILLICLLACGTATLSAQDSMLGEVTLFAGNFAPRGWAFCDGQMLSISQNTALFSILGTQYGGDGRTTFALPKMGNFGTEETLEFANSKSEPSSIPATFTATNKTADPIDMYWISFDGVKTFYAKIQPGTTISQASGTNHVWHFYKDTELVDAIKLGKEANQSYEIWSKDVAGPRYIICTQGYFPSRN
ncbi:MAG: tail fiber protein [Lewinellaceae bacterium]|nr:tail fiber protein [Lewinellaceae bacterium]